MRRSPIASPVAVVALALLLAGCGEPGQTPGSPTSPAPRQGAHRLSAEVLAFDPGGFAPGRYATLADEPINLGAFAGWFGGTLEGSPEEVSAEPGRRYLAATALTHCRSPENVEVWRDGTDLRVRFVGGTDHEECVRAVGPTAYVSVRSRDAAGVRTIDGEAPLDPAGPGRLTDFVGLGPIRTGVAPAELGTPGARTMLERLVLLDAEHQDDATAALTRHVGASERGFAFVLGGCAETGAVLLLDHRRIAADLKGGDGTVCDVPAYFLAAFTVAAEHVPKGAAPGR